MRPLSQALHRLADPHSWELPAQALALLEPLPPGPEHVSALTEMAATEAVQDRNEAGLGYAEQALALAQELGLPRPARALGFRGLARCSLGDRGGLDDMREAISLATEAGQGREVGILHNNLAAALGPVEGPAASLEVLRAGIAFSRVRGLIEMVDFLTANTVEVLVETGEHEQALTLAAELGVQAEASGDTLGLTMVRKLQALILTLRGQATHVADTLDWLETTTRQAGQLDFTITNLAAAALTRSALAQPDLAAALLDEIETAEGARESGSYASLLPAMVRTALSVGNPQLARRLVDGVEPLTPSHEHAVAAANAVLAENQGDLEAAAVGYADAAARWQTFGVVPEQAFALLGQGRTLTHLGRTNEATPVLQQARDIFTRLQAAPALAEVDQLLQQATALSS